MTRWHAKRTPGRPPTAMIAMTLLALLLVAVVPAALLASVIMMILGYLAGGLALSAGVILAAAIAVAAAATSGKRHLRHLLSGGSIRAQQPDAGPHATSPQPAASEDTNVVRLDPSQYTDVH